MFQTKGCQETSDKASAWGLGKLDTEAIFRTNDDKYYVTYTNGQDNRYTNVFNQMH